MAVKLSRKRKVVCLACDGKGSHEDRDYDERTLRPYTWRRKCLTCKGKGKVTAR